MEVDSSVRTDVLCVIAAGDGSKAALSAFDYLIRQPVAQAVASETAGSAA